MSQEAIHWVDLLWLVWLIIVVQTDSNGDHEQGEYGICSDSCPVSVSVFVSEGNTGGGIEVQSVNIAGQNPGPQHGNWQHSFTLNLY